MNAMSHKILLNILVALSIAVLTGCGGGGGDNLGGAGPITEAQRAAVMDAISTQIRSLPPDTLIDPPATAQAMLSFLQSRPEIVQSGVSNDQSIWGVFSDNQPFLIINNEHRPPDRSARPVGPTAGKGSRVASGELPSGSNARLMHMFGTTDILTSDPRGTLDEILKGAGYGTSQESGGLSDFRNPIETAVLYTGGHGGIGGWVIAGQPNRTHYCLWTNEVAKGLGDNSVRANDGPTAEDRITPAPLNPRIVLLNADISSYRWSLKWPLTPDIVTIGEWHWGITAEFVKRYMNFSPNSVWYNGACSGYDPEFRDASFGKHLSAYVAWDNEVNRFSSSNGAMVLFDRLAGSNKQVNNNALQLPAEQPPQRPFPWPSVFNDMQAKGMTTSTQGSIVAHLHIDSNPADAASSFGLLAPSIEHLEVVNTGNNQDELRIFGAFGSTQGTVSIAGVTADVLPGGWTPQEIRCNLRGPEEIGGHGDVVVEVGGHASNPVQLTLWEITFTDTQKRDWSGRYVFQQPVAPDFTTWYADPTGSLTVTTEFKLFVRGDVHLFRGTAGQKPPFNNPERPFVISVQSHTTKDARVSSLSVSGSGTTRLTNDKDSRMTTYFNNFSLEGDSSLRLDGSDSRAQIGSIYGSIDPVNRTLGVVYSVSMDPVVHIDQSSDPPNSGGIGMAPTSVGISFPGNFSGGAKFDLDESYNVVGGSRQATNAVSSAGYTDTLSVSWTSKVFDPPKPDSARSARIRAVRH